MGNKPSRKAGGQGALPKEQKSDTKMPKPLKEQLQGIKKRKLDHHVGNCHLEMAQVCQSLFQEDRERRDRQHEH
jgi:hypothetical protein